MKADIIYFTNKGTVREKNEDSILINEEILSNVNNEKIISNEKIECKLIAVADGMGGHKCGSLASKKVLELSKENEKNIFRNPVETLYNIKKKFVSEDLSCMNMGTTITGIALENDHGVIFHVGDSRIYKINHGYFEKLTRDHSYVQDLYDKGIISEKEMSTHPQKNIITSAIMFDNENDIPYIFSKKLKIKSGDCFFLCTDGVWEKFFTDDLEKIFSENEYSSFMNALLNFCLETGSQDNITAVFIKFTQ